jgi:hypothetical protein
MVEIVSRDESHYFEWDTDAPALSGMTAYSRRRVKVVESDFIRLETRRGGGNRHDITWQTTSGG